MTRLRIAAAAAALVASAAGIATLGGGEDHSSPARLASAVPTYRMETDHATYATTSELRGDADAVVRGIIKDATIVDGEPTGVDGAGDPLPEPPSTHYSVEVLQSLEGDLAAEDVITVVLTGGSTDEGNFVLDGGPVLDVGDEALFYLVGFEEKARGERRATPLWFPLAGGAAIAEKGDDGTYVLPQDVNGTSEQRLDSGGRPAGGSGGGGSGGGFGGGGGYTPPTSTIEPVPPSSSPTVPADPPANTTTTTPAPTSPPPTTTTESVAPVVPAPPVEASGATPGTMPLPQEQSGGDSTPPKLLSIKLGPGQSLASVLRRGLLVRGLCSERCELFGQMRAVAPRGARAAKRARTIVIGSGRAAAGRALVLKLTKAGRKRLRGRSRVSVTFVVRAVDGAGNASSVQRTVTLSRRLARIRD